MKVASSLVSGPHPTADLAATAVRDALQAAGLERADSVLLFLTRNYVRHAQAAVVAAARAAGTLQISGCTAYGLLTEQGWLLDQPGAAALVIADAAPGDAGPRPEPLLSFSGHHALPNDWQRRPERVGLLDAEAVTWSHGRLAGDARAELPLAGIHARIACSPGLRMLSHPLAVNAVAGYDLCALGGLAAINSLHRSLPAELRAEPPLHQIVVARQPGTPAVPILAANADGSLTLAETLAIGEQVLYVACRAAANWPLIDGQALSVAVNLSARQLKEPGLPDLVADALTISGLPPECLELEITESMIMGDVEHTIRVLKSIKALGVRIAVDDFGTGYSSLSYLQRLPIDTLKIDRSFVSGCDRGGKAMAIPHAIIFLGKALNLHIVAEGVETEAEREILTVCGCHEFQGYLFSRPMQAAALGDYLRAGES